MNLEALNEIPAIWDQLSESEKRQILAELDAIEDELTEWSPLPVQKQVLDCDADIILFGGAAGGGKSFLALGKALLQHRRVLILRREFPQLSGLIETSKELYPRYGKYTATPQPTWRLKYKGVDKLIEFGSCQHEHDKNKYQGRAHDLRVLDEAANFLESQVDFLAGWIRTEHVNQKAQLLLLSNPPTASDGQWLFRWFAPWLDKKHPKPASPGELRWFARINGKDTEVSGNHKFVLIDNQIVYDFNPADYSKDKIITPKSRTFIPARVTDNPYYVESGYIDTLQALPEPLRSQMLYGDFLAGQDDDAWQIIPSDWVRQAQARWESRPKPEMLMTALGVDVARGGRDQTILSPRYGNYYDKQLVFPGSSTPDGNAVATLAVKHADRTTIINVDVIGVGTSVYDILNSNNISINPINGASHSDEYDHSGMLGFVNKRAELYWKFRESLDPKNGADICLPPGNELLADLCAARWKLTVRGIQVESKEDIIKRLGRSPDYADSIIYASETGLPAISMFTLR